MLNKALQKEIGKFLPKPVYFIWGEDTLLLEEVLTKAVEVVIASHLKDFNYDTFYPSANPHEVLDAASTLPLMSSRRLVVLKDFHLFPISNIKVITTYFEKPCESTCMLIFSQKEPRKIAREVIDKFSDLPVFHIEIKEADIPAWVKQKAQEKGIKLTNNAVDYLIEFVGHDTGLLMGEIEKLSLSGLKSIDSKDIVSFTNMVRDYTAFNLIDAIITGNKIKAFRILKTLLEGRSFKVESILGALNWHYRQFYNLYKGKGKRPQKMKETTYKGLLKYLPSYTERHFYHIFHELHQADIGIKSSGRPELNLEILLIKLLQRGSESYRRGVTN